MSDINYNMAPINPMAGVMDSLKLGATLGGIRDQRADAQAQAEAARIAAAKKAERDAQIFSLYEDVKKNPTGESYTALANMQDPAMAESTRKNWAMLDEATQKSKLRDLAEVFSLVHSGDIEGAKSVLKTAVEANKNSGKTKAAEDAQRFLTMLETGGELGRETVEKSFGLFMVPLTGGKDAIDAIVNFNKDQREENLEKILKKTPGQLKPNEIKDLTVTLNKEYTTRTKGYTDALRLDTVIKNSAADKSGAGDLALVTSFMKMLDPGSVVRETEFAAAQDTSGLIGKLTAAAAKVQNGQILTQPQRDDFARLASQYMAASADQEKKARKDLEFMVKNYGLNPENVFGTMADENKPATKAIPAGIPAAGTSLRDFIKKEWPDEVAAIDKLTDAELRAKYKKTTARFDTGTGTQPVAQTTTEVDF